VAHGDHDAAVRHDLARRRHRLDFIEHGGKVRAFYNQRRLRAIDAAKRARQAKRAAIGVFETKRLGQRRSARGRVGDMLDGAKDDAPRCAVGSAEVDMPASARDT